jgi:hypothetical protein
VAAVLAPAPDPWNQAVFAAPMIAVAEGHSATVARELSAATMRYGIVAEAAGPMALTKSAQGAGAPWIGTIRETSSFSVCTSL